MAGMERKDGMAGTSPAITLIEVTTKILTAPGARRAGGRRLRAGLWPA